MVQPHDQFGKWLRFARALRRFVDFIESRPSAQGDPIARMGLGESVEQFFGRALDLATDAGIREEYLELFSLRQEADGNISVRYQVVQSIASLEALCGWAEGHIEALQLAGSERVLPAPPLV